VVVELVELEVDLQEYHFLLHHEELMLLEAVEVVPLDGEQQFLEVMAVPES
jgi:hypothetical protein